jgi:hypothetical protein
LGPNGIENTGRVATEELFGQLVRFFIRPLQPLLAEEALWTKVPGRHRATGAPHVDPDSGEVPQLCPAKWQRFHTGTLIWLLQ